MCVYYIIYKCMCVYMCVYKCVCIIIYVCVSMCVCVYIGFQLYTLYVLVWLCLHTCIHM